MENLRLSYREVVHEIPYRTLLLMNEDKMRVVYGDDAKRGGSGKEMAHRRRKNAKTNN